MEETLFVLQVCIITAIVYSDLKSQSISIWLLLSNFVLACFLRPFPFDATLFFDLIPVLLLVISFGLVFLTKKQKSVGGADLIVLASIGIQVGLMVTLVIVIGAGLVGILAHLINQNSQSFLLRVILSLSKDKKDESFCHPERSRSMTEANADPLTPLRVTGPSVPKAHQPMTETLSKIPDSDSVTSFGMTGSELTNTDSFASLGMTGNEEVKISSPKYPFAGYLCILWILYLVIQLISPEFIQTHFQLIYDLSLNSGTVQFNSFG